MINIYVFVLSLVAGLLAALLSYGLNSRALKILGDKAVTFGAPIFEEFLKTGLALLLGGSILVSHITFGVVEAIYDYYKNRGLLGTLSAGAGLLSHSIFGYITVLAPRLGKSPVLGITLALLAHIAWNYGIINMKVRN